ncbi:MAG: hypothetical protein BroJett011_70270 [Chloroflexota bacterium]|nr:MAG: hypothetical protein BroJett011_70270 [Chloroflexota bacterium]
MQRPNLILTEKYTLSRRELVVVVLILLLVIIAWTTFNLLHPAITETDLNLIATMISKDMDLGLYPRDDIFADNTYYRFYTPVYRWLVAQFWQISGSFESGLVYLTCLVLAFYLAGMFFLSRRVIGNTWLALGITVASANYYEAMGEELWGVGGSQFLMSRAVYTATAPYLFLWFLSFLAQPGWFKGVVLGLAIGLAANLHPISGWQFAILVIGLTVLVFGLKRAGWGWWGMLLGLMGAISLGALPIAQSVFGKTGRGLPVEVSFEAFRRVIYEKYTIPFRPATVTWDLAGLELNKPVLEALVWIYVGLTLLLLIVSLWAKFRRPAWGRWIWLVAGLVILAYAYLVALFNLPIFFVLAAGYVIYLFRLRQIPEVDGWLIGWLGLTVLTSFVGYYFLMRAWETFELRSFIAIFTGQIRAARFIYLPLYLLAGRAALVYVQMLARGLRNIGPQWRLKGDVPGASSLALAAGVVLSLAPGLSTLFFTTLPLAIITLAGGVGAVVLAAWLLERRSLVGLGSWGIVLAMAGLLIILFGPLASWFGPFLPIPAINLLDPAARSVEPVYSKDDQDLYNWVKQNTPKESLFYWCDFGPGTTLFFRRYAERSINLNWKDMNLVLYDMANLVSYHQRYRQLEQACQKFDSLVTTANRIEADYILIPAGRAAGIEHLTCFLNSRYALFPVGKNECASQ